MWTSCGCNLRNFGVSDSHKLADVYVRPLQKCSTYRSLFRTYCRPTDQADSSYTAVM